MPSDESVSEEAAIIRFIRGLSDEGLSRVSPILIEEFARRLRDAGELLQKAQAREPGS
jgi:hypothetical protein